MGIGDIGNNLGDMNNNKQKSYDDYKQRMELLCAQKQKEIVKLSKEINMLDNMANNTLNMVDSKIMLDHDAVILMQTLWSYDKHKDVKMFTSYSQNQLNLLNVEPIKQCIDNMVEIIKEDNSIEYNDLLRKHLKYACWEAIKRASFKFYSKMWEKRYGKYINELLQQCNTTEADGILDKYIENVILCDYIDDTDPLVIGIFTYYIMDKGYVLGELYYPPYFEIMVRVFDTIRDNIKKIKFKERLKLATKAQETHYTIDDVDVMNGNEFEYFVCKLYSKMGYKSEVTKQSGDQGLDVIAEKDNKRIGIQAKCYSGAVGNSAVQEAVAGKSYYHCDKVVVITNNHFTSSAIELAQSNNVILWDRDILKEKIKELM